MFSKNSRYRRLPDVVTTDAKGRRLLSKSLRLTPEVAGDFRHVLAEIDRLDHLAYRYYQQSRKWWRVCDANPDFMSPLALLGEEPVVAARFRLTLTGPNPPWAELLQALSETVGVYRAWMDGRERTPEVHITYGDYRFHMPPAFHAELKDGLISEDVRAEFENNDVFLSEKAVVSSHANHWLVADEDEVTYAVLPVPGSDVEEPRLDVYDCVLNYAWSVLVIYNSINTGVEELKDVMQDPILGFEVGEIEMVSRVGEEIVIPPDSMR